MKLRHRSALSLLFLAIVACGSDDSPAVPTADSGTSDSGVGKDAATDLDASTKDAAVQDTGITDAGVDTGEAGDGAVGLVPPTVIIRGANVNGTNNAGLAFGTANYLSSVTNLGSLGGTMVASSSGGSGVGTFLFDANRLASFVNQQGNGAPFVTLPARATTDPWIIGARFSQDFIAQNQMAFDTPGSRFGLWIISSTGVMSLSDLGISTPVSLIFPASTTKDVLFGYDGTNLFVEMDGMRSQQAQAYHAPPTRLGGEDSRMLLTRMALTHYDASATANMLVWLNTP